MELRKALRLVGGTVVSFVGAGGKTSAMRRLVRELAGHRPVLVTTTTHLATQEADLAATHLIWRLGDDLGQVVEAAIEHGSALVSGRPLANDEGKLAGLPVEAIDDLHHLLAERGGVLLVEADGSRQRPLKAPAEHEPVIPPTSDLVVPVIGLRAIGQLLGPEVVHRPERLAQVTDLELGQRIEPAHLVRLLTSTDGSLKGIPPAASVRPLLIGGSDRLEAAQEVAQGALATERLASVVLAPPQENGACLAFGRIAGVVLAAGGASRMGSLKQADSWHGQPLVARAVWAAAGAGLAPIVVVLGAEADRVRQRIGTRGVEVVVNERWNEGQSGSMRAGLAAAAERCEGVVFLLADMPLVDSELISRLVAAHRATLAPIVAPRAANRWGNPVLFDRITFEALAQVQGDRGGRAVFDQFMIEPVPADERALLDVDTAEDWQALD